MDCSVDNLEDRRHNDILRQATDRLRANGLDQPRLLCELLISYIVRCSRLEIHGRANEQITEDQRRQIYHGIERLAGGEPLDYIIGETDFMGRPFKLDSRCLIPRPETELLVDWIEGFDALWKRQRPFIIDVGTGSGCIVISLALDKPEGQYMGVDISEAAISIAMENAQTYGVHNQIRFMTNNLLSGIPSGSVDAVISNPPYVRTADWKQLPSQIRKHEPRVALDGGPDGLTATNLLIDQAFHVLKPEGFLFLEIGEDQWPEIQARLECAGFYNCRVKQDLAKKNRMVRAEKTFVEIALERAG